MGIGIAAFINLAALCGYSVALQGAVWTNGKRRGGLSVDERQFGSRGCCEGVFTPPAIL